MHEARKTVTLLFADVVASTELGERLDPEAVRQVMARHFAEMAEIVGKHGGTVEKFIGDEVMAVFGVPSIHEDDALRAVRAAAAMRERLLELNVELEERWGSRLEIRIGVNTGQVVAGDHSAGHGFVTGDAFNLAKRIEQAAAPGEILLGEATAREEEMGALEAAYARAVETRRSQLLTSTASPASASPAWRGSWSFASRARRASWSDAACRTATGSRSGPFGRSFRTSPSTARGRSSGACASAWTSGCSERLLQHRGQAA